MNKQLKPKVFFPNLDGLRFISFFLVFLSHSFVTDDPAIKGSHWYQITKVRLFSDGDLGVSFFFVLSGFLITYLLLKEKESTGKIHVKNFYIRRALRIWPLYFFCVFFGFVIFPLLKAKFGQTPNETASPVLSSLFLNNFDRILHGAPDSSVLSVLWSVAIEEQFYLIWPLLFLLFPQRRYSLIFFVVISSSLLYRTFLFNGDIELNSLGVISDMAIGGGAAFLAFSNKRFLEFLKNINPYVNLLPYIMAISFIVFKYQMFDNMLMIVFKRVIISFFFAWILLDQNFSERSFFKISRFKMMSDLGKYTYGLYCLHPIAILVSITILRMTGLNTQGWQLWLFEIPLSLSLSILFSYISYHFFEKRFLKMKESYAYITKG
jgi:peptidoglycan/LPS O-acetylase OafA/YrhL